MPMRSLYHRSKVAQKPKPAEAAAPVKKAGKAAKKPVAAPAEAKPTTAKKEKE